MEPSIRADQSEGAAATRLSERWAAFTQAESMGGFAQSWLALVADQVGRTRRGMVLLRGGDGSFVPAAFWPAADTDMTDLAEPARRCLAARAAQAEALVPPPGAPAGPPGLVLAYPLDLRGELRGAVVLDVAGRPEAQVQQAFRALTWGMGWLDAMLRGEEVARLGEAADRSRQVIDLMLRVAEAQALDEAAHLVVDGLAERLALGRASLGLVADAGTREGRHSGRVRLQAMSATAWFDGRSALARRLENAMEEAWDQRGSIAVPAPPDRPAVVDLAHQALASGGTQAVAVASAVVLARSTPLGVLTVERSADRPFDTQELAALEAWAQALGPVLALHREGERWLAGRARRQWLALREAFTDPRRPSWRIGAAVVGLALVALVFADGQWRISAPASIEGAMQRAVVAPFEGFVRTAPVKAGQRVKAGEVLATLDDRDLLLERARHASERDRHERRYRDALSRHERAEARMAAAEMAEAQAQLALVEERLARTRLVAPYDGLVVSGDLTQQLGSPVEKGKTLFEVAPLDAFRVVLKVDESDMRGVAVGQRGQLVLAGLTGDTLGFAVKGISVAAPADGRNAFEVEAQLDAAPAGLRPGMEGVGKIEAGERRLLWIWTHRFTDWLRLKLWQWWP